MTTNLINVIRNTELRNSVKPINMSGSEYESIVIELYNRYGDISIQEFQKKLKIRIAISNVMKCS